jgi:hypothetical protein
MQAKTPLMRRAARSHALRERTKALTNPLNGGQGIGSPATKALRGSRCTPVQVRPAPLVTDKSEWG